LAGRWFAWLPGICSCSLEKVGLATHHWVPSNSTSVTASGLTFLIARHRWFEWSESMEHKKQTGKKFKSKW
jgi:hypothetical protein